MTSDVGAAPDTPGAAPATTTHPAVVTERDQLNLLWKRARLASNTEIVPRTLRGRPDAIWAIMTYGAEIGLQPMTALRNIFIIEGTPSCSAKLMRALIIRAGHRIEFREQTRTRCVLFGERADGRGTSLVEWTIEDAKEAGLLGKDVWKRYPRAMLKARATSELFRDIFPDLELGYTPEELSRVDLSGEYDFIDIDEAVPVDDEDRVIDTATGEIVVDVDTPDHVIQATLLDAEDAMDAEWLQQARDDGAAPF